mmetsp:Transcript_106438/g.129779  ORF Transcript_106438/g.129779 Transcript_106438/m.129779 type:complete len:100 (-) Transcript_106438:279-578(-)
MISQARRFSARKPPTKKTGVFRSPGYGAAPISCALEINGFIVFSKSSALVDLLRVRACVRFSSSWEAVELATEREKALAMTVLAETTMVNTAAAMSSSV